MENKINVIEYDDCVYGLNKDMQKYLMTEINNCLSKVNRIDEVDKEIIDSNIKILIELHNDCHLGMVKLYENPMCGLCVEEID